MSQTSLDVPRDAAGALAGTGPVTGRAGGAPRRRGRSTTAVVRARSVPYLLLLPAAVLLAGVLAYPLYKLVRLSFETFGLRELITHEGRWVGTANYREILGDREFWRVTGRTVAFTVVNVALTMALGTLIALLLERLGRVMRFLITTALICVWATPVIVAIDMWQWMVDFEFGIANYVLTALGLDYANHNWFESTLQGFGVITACVVWGAIPFVAITLYAGLAQLPGDLVEAARVDGANAWAVFRRITFPILKPIFVILTSLSIIWDFQVFNQVWVMLGERPTSDYYLIGIYSFVQSFGLSAYGLGSAIAVVMVLILLGVTFFYIRQMVRIGETR